MEVASFNFLWRLGCEEGKVKERKGGGFRERERMGGSWSPAGGGQMGRWLGGEAPFPWSHWMQMCFWT